MSGCIGRKNTTKEVLKHMQNKYDDTFEYAAPFGGGMGNKSTQMILSSEKYPGKRIWVWCFEDESGDVQIADNYVGVKYEKQTAELLNNILENVVGENFTLFYDAYLNTATKGASDEMTFEEYIAEPTSNINFIAIVDSQGEIDRDAFEQALEKNIVESGLCCRMANIYFDSNNNYNLITKENLESYMVRDQCDFAFLFDMMDNMSFDNKRWG